MLQALVDEVGIRIRSPVAEDRLGLTQVTVAQCSDKIAQNGIPVAILGRKGLQPGGKPSGYV